MNYQITEDPNYLLLKKAYDKGEYIGLEFQSINEFGEPMTVVRAGFISHVTQLGCIFVYGQWINKDKDNEDIILIENSVYYQDIISVIYPFVVQDNKDAETVVKMREKAELIKKNQSEAFNLLEDNVIAEIKKIDLPTEKKSSRNKLIIKGKRTFKEILLKIIGRGI